jgi:chloramphenicol O-acetyltransferase
MSKKMNKEMMNNNLLKYQKWLMKRDLSPETFSSYLKYARHYGSQPLNTTNLRAYVQENLTKYKPNSLTTVVRTLKAYANFQRARID